MNKHEPAFPVEPFTCNGQTEPRMYSGVTKFEFVAALAMLGILSANAKCDPEVDDVNVDYVVAREALASADAFFAELEKRGAK